MMTDPAFRIELAIKDPAGDITITTTSNHECYPSERGARIAGAFAQLRRMLAAEFPGEFADDKEGF